LVLASGLIFAVNVPAQEPDAKKREQIVRAETKKDSLETFKADEQTKRVQPSNEINTEQTAEPLKAETPIPAIVAKTEENNLSSEEAAVISYYNNYLTEYRLGPNDVISVEVFGQCPDYCKNEIVVPPTARVSYPLIRGGVMVGGRTVEQVQEEITKKLDEYIIEPKVTVTLVKAMSARYSVMGKVTTPGIRVMDRKVSLYEAVVEAGGILKTGNKKKITLVRFNAQGGLSKQEVNLTAIESGKAPMIYLEPGDQVFVPGKGFTIDTLFSSLEKVSLVRLLFGSPF
jgi:polysaccharide export outer membrane protein